MDKNYKYSDYLDAQQKLEQLNFSSRDDLVQEIKQMLEIFEAVELINNGKVKRNLDDLEQTLNNLYKYIKEYNNRLDLVISPTRLELLKQSNLEFDWVPSQNELIDKRSQFSTPRYILEDLSGIIGKKVHWEFPVLYFEPNTADITRLLVAGEPFYIVDDYLDNIKYVLDRLTPEMKNKVHQYSRADMQDKIPNDSIGFAAVWKNFVFKKISNIQKDLELISQKLMPGGHLLFDFNDGETVAGARCAENQVYAFHWKERINRYLEQCDLELIQYTKLDFSTGLTAALVKKKGTLVETNLVNKLGIICLDQTVRQKNSEIKDYYLNIIQKINQLENNNQIHQKIKIELERAFTSQDNKKLIKNKRDKILQQIKGVKHTQGTRSVSHVQLLLSASRLSCPLEEYDMAIRFAQQAQRYCQGLNNEQLKNEVDEWINILKN